MFRYQVVFEHIEQQILLPEQLKAIWLLIFAFFADIIDESNCLSVNNAGCGFLGLVGHNNEEVI